MDTEVIYQERFEKLKQEIQIGIEASERGQVIDSKTVFSQLQDTS